MSVSEGDLLSLGLDLAGGNCEAQWRASVSRSYYAAYHTACAWHDKLLTPGIARSGRGVHATLIECLVNPTVTGQSALRSRAIGYMLQHLKASRTKADYQLTCAVEQSEAQTVAQAVARLIEKAV